ncbi:MAG: hypothetical protein ACR2QM_09480, partial [Longimicrobiales bacterium]
MTTPRWPADATTRVSRWLIRVSARMVPSSRRAMWLQEWEAELWQLRAEGRGAAELAWFVIGAVWHGLYEGWDRRAFSMNGIGRDVRYALRQLARSPGFTGASLLLLGSSIGASTALFSVLERAVLAEPPFPAPDRLVIVDQLFGEGSADMNPAQWSYPRFEA